MERASPDFRQVEMRPLPVAVVLFLLLLASVANAIPLPDKTGKIVGLWLAPDEVCGDEGDGDGDGGSASCEKICEAKGYQEGDCTKIGRRELCACFRAHPAPDSGEDEDDDVPAQV